MSLDAMHEVWQIKQKTTGTQDMMVYVRTVW